MSNRRTMFWLFLCALTISPALGYAQPACVAPVLSGQQVKDLIDKARETRTDLAAPFSKYKWSVTRQWCHYVYVETGLPERPDYRQSFKLNQYGAIVDADKSNLKCPDNVLSESELAEIVRKERSSRRDLPEPFPNFNTRVSRRKCVYFYIEYALPGQGIDFQVFTIDHLGELMGAFRSRQ